MTIKNYAANRYRSDGPVAYPDWGFGVDATRSGGRLRVTTSTGRDYAAPSGASQTLETFVLLAGLTLPSAVVFEPGSDVDDYRPPFDDAVLVPDLRVEYRTTDLEAALGFDPTAGISTTLDKNVLAVPLASEYTFGENRKTADPFAVEPGYRIVRIRSAALRDAVWASGSSDPTGSALAAAFALAIA